MTPQIKKQIDSQLNDAKNYLEYVNGVINWETFFLRALSEHSKFNNNEVSKCYFEWLSEQKHNKLSLTSSGGTLQSLMDLDHILDDVDLTTNMEITSYFKEACKALEL